MTDLILRLSAAPLVGVSGLLLTAASALADSEAPPPHSGDTKGAIAIAVVVVMWIAVIVVVILSWRALRKIAASRAAHAERNDDE